MTTLSSYSASRALEAMDLLGVDDMGWGEDWVSRWECEQVLGIGQFDEEDA